MRDGGGGWFKIEGAKEGAQNKKKKKEGGVGGGGGGRGGKVGEACQNFHEYHAKEFTERWQAKETELPRKSPRQKGGGRTVSRPRLFGSAQWVLN